LRILAVLAIALVGVSTADATYDKQRAIQKIPGIHVRGTDHIDMVQKLNHRLIGTPGLITKACDAFTVDELTALQKSLFASRQPELQAIYAKTNDNRQLAAFGQLSEDMDSLEALWDKEKAIVDANPALHDIVRDGKCHEAVMWWVHHIPDATKDELKSLLSIPLLAETPTPHCEEEVFGKAPAAAVQSAMAGYKTATGCGICHASDFTEENTESKVWPASLSYNATGYGSFPFWDATPPGCGSCNRTLAGQKVSVKYDSTVNSELIMHTSCGNMSWVGASDYPAATPCNHLFNSEYGAFIYTPESALSSKADGKFCCRSYAAGDTVFPGAVPANWSRSQYLYTDSSGNANISGFTGDFYSGEVKIYWSQALGVDFWYYETPDGVPVEQGEGCYFPGVSTHTTCEDPLPIMFYHDYDPATFKQTTHTASEFELPDVCKGDLLSTCTAPGGSGRRALGAATHQQYRPVMSFHARQAGVGPKV